ncbi:MAG: 30S ribosomal protein S17 [Lentisphaerae bacterium]|jgi:small subunit ribosomal protein S17|nr:30S ribosomal protein S17 [Lentisphaerota bacterium]
MSETTDNRGIRKVRKGVVVSRSGDKSIVVQAERRLRHPLLGKVVRQFKKYHAHDENNEAKVGDQVVITECRPMSKMKRWRLVSQGVAEGAQQ